MANPEPETINGGTDIRLEAFHQETNKSGGKSMNTTATALPIDCQLRTVTVEP
jgi:hypothetical protein